MSLITKLGKLVLIGAIPLSLFQMTAPAAAQSGNPLLGPQGTTEEPANPLGDRSAAVDPFARKFAGDNMKLELAGTAAEGYRGSLTFRGNTYPAVAQSRGNELRGMFRASGREYRFAARRQGDQLALTSGGKHYRLIGERRAAPSQPNPLADENPLANENAGATEAAEESGPLDVETSRPTTPAPGTRRFVNRTSGVACNLPEGWTVFQESPQGCTINPGFQRGQTIEATFSLHCVPLEAAQRGTAVDRMLTTELPDFRKSLASGGIQTEAPDRPVQLIQVNGRPAAMVALRARTQQGQPGLVWIAVRVEGDRCLVLSAVFINGKEREFMARVQRVFASLKPAAAAAAALPRE